LEEIIIKNPTITTFILWSDSCVAQNRNKMMSSMLLFFINKHPNVKLIVQKYSEAHHSLVQEVDTLHAQIEKKMKHVDIYSPLGYVENLENINSKKISLKILNLEKKDFFYGKTLFNILIFLAFHFQK
jgi:predicted RND superfamily exporter protein